MLILEGLRAKKKAFYKGTCGLKENDFDTSLQSVWKLRASFDKLGLERRTIILIFLYSTTSLSAKDVIVSSLALVCHFVSVFVFLSIPLTTEFSILCCQD